MLLYIYLLLIKYLNYVPIVFSFILQDKCVANVNQIKSHLSHKCSGMLCGPQQALFPLFFLSTTWLNTALTSPESQP